LGTIPSGGRALTIVQVAALAGVSRSTASRVLNGHPSVRGDVRERVTRVIADHDYVPQAAARSLVRRRTDVIGLILPWDAIGRSSSNQFLATVVRGMSDACTEQGRFLMTSMVPDPMKRDFYERFVRGRHVDGVVMPLTDLGDPLPPLFLRDRRPLVLIDRHPSYPGLSCVHAANRDGARAAVRHLLDLGHRRIATITGPPRMTSTRDRRDGYEDALREAALPIDPALVAEGDYTEASGRRAMARILDLAPPPTAVFAANDEMAVGALRAAAETGFTVPDDVAVVGFDDGPVAEATEPPLTTVRQSGYDLGRAGAAMLINQLDAPGGDPRHVCLPTTLTVRRSCGATPGKTSPERAMAGAKGGRV
jgi:LacI family transcriptional regulator